MFYSAFAVAVAANSSTSKMAAATQAMVAQGVALAFAGNEAKVAKAVADLPSGTGSSAPTNASRAAIAALRKDRCLRQTDIPGLSERQLRRIEDSGAVSVRTMEHLADAHGMVLAEYLDALAHKLKPSRMSETAAGSDARRETSQPRSAPPAET